MQNRSTLRMFIPLLFLCSSLSASGPDREIQGYVQDAKTSEPLAGATVMVKGFTTGAITGNDGYYRIKGLRDGENVLVFRFLSYETREIKCTAAEPVTRLDVSLASSDASLSEVFVSARMYSHTETSMLSAVKLLPQVASGISAAQIAKSPDRTAAEAVRRVPGVTIIDERFIIVRGLAQRYNNTWINGLAVPSTETDSRAFPLDLIPGGQIDNLLVYKSPSPEIPGDFSGGFLKITSKSIPDENSIEFSYTTGFNTRTHGNNFRINPGSSTDFLGFDLNKRVLSDDFPAHLGTVRNPDEITRLTKEGFNSDWRVRKTRMPLPDQRLSLTIARRMETARHQAIGHVTALTYSNTSRSVEGMKNARYGIYSALADRPVLLDNYDDSQYSNDVRLGALHNWSFALNPFHHVEFKSLLNMLGRNRLTERAGIKDMSSMYYREQTEMLYTSRLSCNGQFSGTHDLSPDRRLTWNAGYSYAGKTEPDRRIVTNQAGVGSVGDIPVPTGNDNITRYFQHLHDHLLSAAVNYRRTFPETALRTTLKAGIYGEYHDRDYHVREFIYRYDRLSYDERQAYLKLPFEEMMSSEYLGADRVYADEISRKTNNYAASVLHGAGYAAIEITPGKCMIYAGVRIENHSTELIRDRSDAPDLVLKTVKRICDLEWLPSLNMTYKFSGRHQLRAAYGHSINRPELRELSPAVYFDFDLFSEIGGNENLKKATVDNLDLRYEFYPSFGETVSLGVFYKHFRNPIEWTFIDMGGSLRYHYENAKAATGYGIELDVHKKLDFIGLRDFSLLANVALIKSRVHFQPGEIVPEPDRPMQGQSPCVINAGIYYRAEKHGTNISLLYNRIGKRIVGLGKSNSIHPDINTLIPDSYEMPRNSLDFTIGKNIGKNMEIRCSVRDILAEAIVYRQFPKFEKDGVIHSREQVTRQYNPGQSISAGILLKIK